MKPRDTSVSEAIRQAIRESGLKKLELSRRAKVDNSQLSRFMRGQRGLSTPTIDRLAKVLGLRMTQTKSRRTGRRT